MKELNEEELLSILTAVFSYYLSKCNYKETATKYEEAHQQIKEMIQKPRVTKEWLKEKVKEMEQVTIPINSRRKDREDFIRSFVEEIKGEK